jgi:hypothetical protein
MIGGTKMTGSANPKFASEGAARVADLGIGTP